MSRELILYCDESERRGRYFSNFYGGLLIPAEHFPSVSAGILELKDSLGLRAELKWSSITPSVSGRYCEMLTALFEEVRLGRVKLRVMFTQNRHVPILSREQREIGYHLLYYQFIKHAFGLQYGGSEGHDTRIRVFLDKMPTTREQASMFKGYIGALSLRPEFRRARIRFSTDRISEIDSKKHILAQCLDIVLGAMSFRLNDKHKDKPAAARRRGNRTIHKEKVYRHINGMIRDLYPGFNIGISTGQPNGPTDRWTHPYRHWLFVPQNAARDDSLTKRRKAP